MWNIISCKSQYKEYLKQRHDEKLCNNLNSMKALIDTSQPKTMKRKQRKSMPNVKPKTSRTQQITEENRSLLNRMLRIDLIGPSLLPERTIQESSSLKSLNGGFRRKKLEEIQNSNKQLIKRLKSTNSVYSKAQWVEANRFHEYIRDNISRNSGRVILKKPFEDTRRNPHPPEFSCSVEDSFENLLIK